MTNELLQQILELKTMSLEDLRKKHNELFDRDHDMSVNKSYYLQKIAYRLQEQALGALSEEAKARAVELIGKFDPINNKALRPQVTTGNKELVAIPLLRDKRLPIPGSVIQKKYKGQDIHVKVLEKGFEYNGRFYRSLGAIVEEITGSHWNGFSFFGL